MLDRKALEFTHSFYALLLRGDSVRQAFDVGRDRPVNCTSFSLLVTFL